MRIGGGGALTDPFKLEYFAPLQAFRETGARTLADPRLVSGERTGVFICAGQSNIANSVDVGYSVTNPTKIQNLNIFDGGVYETVDPLLGCSSTGGSWLGRMGDKLITANIFDRVILVPIGRGGSSVTDWLPSAPLGSCLKTAVTRCAARGYSISGFLWQQGEADASAGMTQSTYSANLANVIAPFMMAPWFIGRSTYVSGVTNASIRAACTAAVNGTTVFAGADTDTLNASSRQSDNLHFNASGANSAATLWTTAIESVY